MDVDSEICAGIEFDQNGDEFQDFLRAQGNRSGRQTVYEILVIAARLSLLNIIVAFVVVGPQFQSWIRSDCALPFFDTFLRFAFSIRRLLAGNFLFRVISNVDYSFGGCHHLVPSAVQLLRFLLSWLVIKSCPALSNAVQLGSLYFERRGNGGYHGG